MTKLKVCDISEGASRVEHGILCVFVCVCVSLIHTLTCTYAHSRQLALTRMVHARTSSGPAVKKYSSCRAA